MKPSKQLIQTFLEPKKLAIAGVSRDSKKFGNAVFRELKEKGFVVYPINPNVDTILGEKCYPSVSVLPADVSCLLIVTPKLKTLDILKEAVSKGIKNIWIQQMAETPEVIDYVKSRNLSVIMKQCILMYAEPVKGFHKFHRTIKKIFGLLPK
jgi:uncharacterized protein